MKLKSWLATVILAVSFTDVVPAKAAPQSVRYETAMMGGNAAEQGTAMVPVARRRYRRSRYRRHVVVRRRSKGKSAAIVGGSALGGAAIGGLAGGGKGAAIGAAVGGGAGLIYDRKTHKKVVER